MSKDDLDELRSRIDEMLSDQWRLVSEGGFIPPMYRDGDDRLRLDTGMMNDIDSEGLGLYHAGILVGLDQAFDELHEVQDRQPDSNE